jgi:uncharacterized small protein (DUF1192 family)
MAGFLDTTVKDIDQRLSELKEEIDKLEAARSALTGGRSQRQAPARASRTSRTASRGTRSTTQRRRPGRPRGRRSGNTRASQALELVRSEPGITIPRLASAMKIQPNYLYRVMPSLEKDGSIRRNGQGWFPADK